MWSPVLLYLAAVVISVQSLYLPSFQTQEDGYGNAWRLALQKERMKRESESAELVKAANLAPRSSFLISGRGFMPGFFSQENSYMHKRSEDNKRGGRQFEYAPRSGLIIGGRGWMPGFAESRWSTMNF